jgi:hypothetical protein
VGPDRVVILAKGRVAFDAQRSELDGPAFVYTVLGLSLMSILERKVSLLKFDSLKPSPRLFRSCQLLLLMASWL